MSARSTVLKNQGSNAKRAATTLRGLANDAGLDIADRGVLLAAAKIADSFAHRKEREAKQAKADEAKYERDNKQARANIEPVVRALPSADIADKVVLACLINHFYSHLVRSLSQPTRREIQWELDYYADTACRDTIANAAWWVATGKGSAEQAIKDIKSKHLDVKNDPKVIALTQRFVTALQPTQLEAA